MNHIELFMASLNTPNTVKVVKHVLKDADPDIEHYSIEELSQFVLESQPKSPKAITTICYILGLYAKWLHEKELADDSMAKNVSALDKKALWATAKPKAKKKFLSYEQYSRVLHDIDAYEEYNPSYYKALFMCIYEGIYNDDLSVLVNLRLSDINGNTVTLREDNGHTYKLNVSDALVHELRELAEENVWRRRNRNGICQIGTRGLYPDSVFKVEKRTTASDKSLKFVYYAKLRKISEDFLEYHVLPVQLFASGVMHRIKTALYRSGISVDTAFSPNCRDKKAYEIISNELIRCNSIISVTSFRELVQGNLDSF